MPLVLAALVAVTLLPSSSQAAGQDQTITLLVRNEATQSTSSPAGSLELTGWHPVEVPVRGTVEQTIARLEALTGSEVAIDRRYELSAPQDDPGFSDQWYHENVGQEGGVPDADIDSTLAWGSALGDGVVVAVIDSGVDMSHPELAAQVHPAKWDFVDDDNDPSPVGGTFAEGHGTAVAGLIAAAANGLGIVGVAPDSTIMAIRSCSGGSCTTHDLSNGIVFAVDRGADIINLSLGSITSEDQVLEDAIDYARSRDVLVVTAAGNEGTDLDELSPGQQLIPGGLPLSNILTVAATDRSDTLAGFSNHGPSTVDIAAPGVDMLTTGAGGGYVVADGTSFASPIVAGVAALLLSDDPGIGHQELFARITAFVDKPVGVAGATNSGRVNAGRVITTRFSDTSSSVFVNAIDWLADEGITEGCNPPANHQYCPSNRVSRGEMAVFLTRAFDLPQTNNDFFGDDEGTFYEGAANRLAQAGLTVGCGGDNYCGDSDIRRDEMAAMLARALSLPPAGTDFFDDDSGSIFENAINKIAAVGVTEGCNPPANDNFCPSNRVTRGEMAAFIKRAVEQ